MGGPVLASAPHHPLPGLHDEAALGREGSVVDGRHQRVRTAVLATHHLLQDLALARGGVRGHPGVVGVGPARRAAVPAGDQRGVALAGGTPGQGPAGRGQRPLPGQAASLLTRPRVRQLLVLHVQKCGGRSAHLLLLVEERGGGEKGRGRGQGRDRPPVDLGDDVDLGLDLLAVARVPGLSVALVMTSLAAAALVLP